MRNFTLIATGIDTYPLMNAISHQNLWDENTIRTKHPMTAHSQVSDILLRFNDLNDDLEKIIDGHESINFPAMYKLPQVRSIIFDLMRRVEGERLGRVLITRLPPGGKIDEHIDGGDHAAYYERYQIMLKNLPGSTFYCGGEELYMPIGTCWWFDNGKLHSVVNNSVDDRIALIVDIKCSK